MLLDADNQLEPSGIVTLYRAARETGAVMVYGNIVGEDESGRIVGVMSNERVAPRLLEANYIDALVLVRTERLVALDGYDPEAGVEDWELNLRLLHRGEPIAFVPALVARYRVAALSMVRDASCTGDRIRRGQRVYGLMGPPALAEICASAYHPATGYLWRSPAWRTEEGTAAPAAPARPGQPSPRILVVSSGGVRNHGDDAILLSTLQRLQRLRPGCAAVVVSDGEDVPPLGRLAAWAGTTRELCQSLPPALIERGCQGHPRLAGLSGKAGAQGRDRPAVPLDLRSFDRVVFCGGGYLNSLWPELTAWRTAIAAAARAAKVPYVVTGQGVGPVTPEITDMLALFANESERFGVRDPLSADLLCRHPVSCPHVDVVGDDALGLAVPPPGRVDDLLRAAGVPSDISLLGFHARLAPGHVGLSDAELLATAELVDEVAAHQGQAVVCLPINTQSWGPEAELLVSLMARLKRRRARWFLVDCAEDVSALAAVIGRCAAVIAHSYHVALFALERGVPALLRAQTEYYLLKAEGLRTFFGLPDAMVLSAGADRLSVVRHLQRLTEAAWSPAGAGSSIDRWLGEFLPAAVREQGPRRAA
jgi:polysaccharide pyruvyl transferase WcaK-like protein